MKNPSQATSTHAGGSADAGLRLVAEMLAGMLLYGGLGWLGDHFLGTSWLMPVGLLLGFGLSVYMVVRRYGRAFSASEDGR